MLESLTTVRRATRRNQGSIRALLLVQKERLIAGDPDVCRFDVSIRVCRAFDVEGSCAPQISDSLDIVHRSLALEYVNRAPTLKSSIESELPFLFRDEPAVPHSLWHAPESTWPVTMWPAFEAVKCAELQSLKPADDLAWSIRVSLFAESRCISMRHVLLDLANDTGLDLDQFESDFDAGTCKQLVIAEARQGWEELRLPGSPTWVMPNGEVISDFGLAEIHLDSHGEPAGALPGTDSRCAVCTHTVDYRPGPD